MIVLLVCIIVVGVGLIRGVQVFDEFVEGAKQGASTAIRLFPYILAMIVAVNLLQASGLLTLVERSFGGLAESIFLPQAVLPLVLLRPLTGSGSMVLTHDILEMNGPDSFVGLLASIIQGSSDTTLYVVTVYFGSIGVNKMRHTLIVGFLSYLAGIVAAVLLALRLFG